MVVSPQGAVPAQPRNTPLELGPGCLRVPRAPALVTQVPTVVPTPATAGARMPAPAFCVHTQTCSQGSRKTGQVAGDSTGPGAIPTPTSKLQESAPPEEQVPAGSLPLRPGGIRAGPWCGAGPCARVPVGLCRTQLCCWQRGQPGEDCRDCARVPSVMDRGCQEGPGKHLASVYL